MEFYHITEKEFKYINKDLIKIIGFDKKLKTTFYLYKNLFSLCVSNFKDLNFKSEFNKIKDKL